MTTPLAPTANAFPQNSGVNGALAIPVDEIDNVQASTVAAGFLGAANGLAYTAALTLGAGNSPLIQQPHAIAQSGPGSGICRIQQSAAAPTDLRTVAGNIGDVVMASKYGLYQLQLPTSTADDSVYILAQADAAVLAWVPLTKYAGLTVRKNGGVYYVAIGQGTAGNGGGPVGLGLQPDPGSPSSPPLAWFGYADTPRWYYSMEALRGPATATTGVAKGFATLDSGALVPIQQLPATITSVGAPDAHKVVELDAGGKLDPSVFPPASPTAPGLDANFVASEGWGMWLDPLGMVHFKGKLKITSAAGVKDPLVTPLAVGLRPLFPRTFVVFLGHNGTSRQGTVVVSDLGVITVSWPDGSPEDLDYFIFDQVLFLAEQ